MENGGLRFALQGNAFVEIVAEGDTVTPMTNN